MRTFQVSTNPYGDGRIYLRKNVTFESGHLTCLVGCNGSGKSTLMMLLREQLTKDKDVLILEYNDRTDGGNNLMSKMMFFDDLEGLASMFMSSEGEKISQGVGRFIADMRRQIQKKDPKEIWIFMDAVGSGLSIDKIREIKEIVPIIVEDNPRREVFFIVSTNEYEFACCADCIDVTAFKHLEFYSYGHYRDYILKTAEKKAKRYKQMDKKRQKGTIK